MLKSSYEDYGVSSTVSIILIVSVAILLTVTIGSMTFDMSDDVSLGASAGVSVDRGSVRVDSMGTAEKLIVKRNGKTFELDTVGETQNLRGGEKIIAVNKKGERRLLRRVTEEDVLNSGGSIYKDPSTLDKNDLSFTSSTDHYSGGEKRILGTSETFKLKFLEKYNPKDFTYKWSKNCEYNCGLEWEADKTVDNNKAKYEYTKIGTDYYAQKSPQVTISGPNLSYTFTVDRYKVYNPIKSVSFETTTDHYSGKEKRIKGTSESWEISNITLYSKVEDVLESDTPSNFDDYSYSEWSKNCEYNCQLEWEANIISNDHKAKYEYTKIGTDYYAQASPAISITIPELGTTQTFAPSKRYKVYNPIKSVSFDGNMTGETRYVGDIEKWELTNISLRSKVSEVLGSDTPSNFDDYSYSEWYKNCKYNCGLEWEANIISNDHKAKYEYTVAGTDTYAKASPRVSVIVPELGTTQTFSYSNRYKVYD